MWHSQKTHLFKVIFNWGAFQANAENALKKIAIMPRLRLAGFVDNPRAENVETHRTKLPNVTFVCQNKRHKTDKNLSDFYASKLQDELISTKIADNNFLETFFNAHFHVELFQHVFTLVKI